MFVTGQLLVLLLHGRSIRLVENYNGNLAVLDMSIMHEQLPVPFSE
jgi:hypothetical protein